MSRRASSISKPSRGSEEQTDTDSKVSKSKKNGETETDVKLSKSRRNGENDLQPKIKEALRSNSDDQPLSPATGADIQKILFKLDAMQTDNETIKTQLREIKGTFEGKIEALETRVSEITCSLSEEINENKEEVQTIRSTVEELEKSMEFQGRQLETNRKEMSDLRDKQKQYQSKITEIEERENKLKSEIKQMKEKTLDMEWHNINYNLLFYGIQTANMENIHDTVKTFLRDEVKIPEKRVEQMIIVNAHRIPNRGPGPNPIIVRFACWSDRELVISQVYKGVLPKNKNIMTDLPQPLKNERHQLMKEAYTLRNSAEKYRTRILEKGLKLKLQFRKDASVPWVDYK